MTEPALSIRDLAKAIERPVLTGIDLDLPAGEILAIVGASGAGKTTLLRTIAGLARPDRGTITIGGRAVCCPGLSLPPEQRHVGYLAQEGALFPHLTVEKNISFGIRKHPERRARVTRTMALVDLPSAYRTRHPHELSGGEQQRVALARALAPDPRLLLLDEPFSGLDATLRSEVRDAVVAVLAKVGTAAVLVTHDPAEAMMVGHQVAVLSDGGIAQCADPVTLYRLPISPKVATLLGPATLLPAEGEGPSIRSPLGWFISDVSVTGPLSLMIRPEQIVPVEPYGDAPAIAAVIGVRSIGAVTELRLRLDTRPEIELLAQTFSHAAPGKGQRIAIRIAGDICVYPDPNAQAAIPATRNLLLTACHASPISTGNQDPSHDLRTLHSNDRATR